MRKEYLFYTRGKERLEQIEYELERKAAARTEAEREAETERARREAVELREHAARAERTKRYVPSEPRRRAFDELCEKAVYLADRTDCDLVVESDLRLRGRLTMRAKHLWFAPGVPDELLPFFVELLEHADATRIAVENGMIRIELEYELADEVRRAENT